EAVFIKWKEYTKGRKFTSDEFDIANYMCIHIPFEIAELVTKISGARNSINHFGYSNIGSYSANSLTEKLKTYFNEFIDVCLSELDRDPNNHLGEEFHIWLKNFKEQYVQNEGD
ncbi:MAG: hypothetical protein K5989_12245, partial [Lachnospiraceae bacterium]|nr:hypothetical protein [Lachnospiraceae bacterium]